MLALVPSAKWASLLLTEFNLALNQLQEETSSSTKFGHTKLTFQNFSNMFVLVQ